MANLFEDKINKTLDESLGGKASGASSAFASRITAIMEQCANEIRGNMKQKNINASGRTSASIAVQTYDEGIKVVSLAGNHAPLPTTEVGRKGGKVPSGFRFIIEEWSHNKGIQFATDRERMTFSYFVARRIAQDGTLRNKQNEDVYSSPVERAKAEIGQIWSQLVVNSIKTHKFVTSDD